MRWTETEFSFSTCCIVLLDESRSVIRAANLGDSGFFLFRRVSRSLFRKYKKGQSALLCKRRPFSESALPSFTDPLSRR